MRAYYSDVFELPLPGGHRFPVDKYRRLRERVATFAATRGIQLLEMVRETKRTWPSCGKLSAIGCPLTKRIGDLGLRKSAGDAEACVGWLTDR